MSAAFYHTRAISMNCSPPDKLISIGQPRMFDIVRRLYSSCFRKKNNNKMAQKLSNYDISQIIDEFAEDSSSEIDDNVDNDDFELG